MTKSLARRVVVPCWSPLSHEMRVETGCSYAAFIRLGSRPLYEHIVDLHKDGAARHSVHVVLPSGSPSALHEELLGHGLRAVLLDHSPSIAHTVLAGLAGLVRDESVAVHMADTVLKLDAAPVDDTVYVDPRSDLYRWTTIAVDSAGVVSVAHDRDDQDLHVDPQLVCVGLFTFSDGQLLKRLLEEATAAAPADGKDPFFHVLERYSRQRVIALTPTRAWFDCGHLDTYYESRLGYQNLRHFNALRYDASRGLVTKTSTRTASYRHQVRWFKQVPDSLSAFLPRVFDSSDADEPFITMELLSIPTLSELFVQERLPVGAWNGVVQTIGRILLEFRRYADTTTVGASLARSIYIDKTRQRLQDYLAARPEAAGLHVVIGNERKVNVEDTLRTLDDFVSQSELLNLESLCPIHGDFCFSNLMFDPRARIVKMIDPRGEFGVPGIYGDPRYDLAKLAHSVIGGYDFIVSDRFDVSVADDGALSLQLHSSDYHRRVREIFAAVIFKDNAELRQIQALQALLFLSMLPLHGDTPRRQLAMLATGLHLFHCASAHRGDSA